MAITVICAGCGKRLKAKDSLAGRTVNCPNCGTKRVIKPSEDVGAALLLDQEASGSSPDVDEPPPERPTPPQRQAPEPAPQIERPRKTQPTTSALANLPPLTTNDPPFWLRHLHWLLILSLIPLALSLLQPRNEETVEKRLMDTLANAPPDLQGRIAATLLDIEDGKASFETLFTLLPDHRLRGAFLPRETWMHWLFTLAAAVLFFLFLLALTADGSATAREVLTIGLFTATIGILFLFLVQLLAAWSQGFLVIPRSIVGILLLVVKIIGYSYRAALDPENGFFLSFLGFTLGVGLCEEICKVLPLLFKYRQPNELTWRGAYLWGLASGAGFGLAESIIYASDFYNGIEGAGIYVVRDISCVALHALWSGSAAITIHRHQHLLQAEMAWHDLI